MRRGAVTRKILLMNRDRRGDWRGEPGERRAVALGRPATVTDLRRVRGKAEIVDGALVLIGPSGCAPATAAGNILVSLHEHETARGGGHAIGSRVAYVGGGRSFCPDASWWDGEPGGAGFLRGAPAFAVEVRDEGEYGPAAEEHAARKRAEYFAAGTRVVWDVDVLRQAVIRVYRSTDPDTPVIYRRGEMAEAEPAVQGWRFPVDELWS